MLAFLPDIFNACGSLHYPLSMLQFPQSAAWADAGQLGVELTRCAVTESPAHWTCWLFFSRKQLEQVLKPVAFHHSSKINRTVTNCISHRRREQCFIPSLHPCHGVNKQQRATLHAYKERIFQTIPLRKLANVHTKGWPFRKGST